MGRVARALTVAAPLTVTSNVTLDGTRNFILLATDGVTITLPDSTLFPGLEIFVALSTSIPNATYTIATSGGQNIHSSSFPSAGQTSIVGAFGNSIIYSGDGTWHVQEGNP